MGFFGAIARPFRGVGRLLTGNFKGGLNDLAATGKIAAPILAATGVGLPLSLAIGAGSGALEGATDDDPGGELTGALGGAAGTGLGYGAGRLLGAGVGESGRSIGSRLLGTGESIVTDPEKLLTAGGIASDVYGNYRQGQALDRMADLNEEELRRTWSREDATDPVLQDIVRRLLGRLSPTPAG